MEQFYKELADILEVDEVKPGDALQNFEAWDSLGVLSLIAMADKSYGVNLSRAELQGLTTAGELAELVAGRRRR